VIVFHDFRLYMLHSLLPNTWVKRRVTVLYLSQTVGQYTGLFGTAPLRLLLRSPIKRFVGGVVILVKNGVGFSFFGGVSREESCQTPHHICNCIAPNGKLGCRLEDMNLGPFWRSPSKQPLYANCYIAHNGELGCKLEDLKMRL
jgi:hypothetical protein